MQKRLTICVDFDSEMEQNEQLRAVLERFQEDMVNLGATNYDDCWDKIEQS